MECDISKGPEDGCRRRRPFRRLTLLCRALLLMAGLGTGSAAHAIAPSGSTAPEIPLSPAASPSSGPAARSLPQVDANIGSPPDYATVRRIHAEINRGTRYASDEELYGQAEFWEVARGVGDCEDYALAKRAALLSAGVRPAHLRLATAWVDTGEYHLVLIVTTDRGEYVLDARHAGPMVRQELEAQGYRWHLIEEGGRWFALL